MKKENLKIFSACFTIAYSMITGLSLVNGQPLVFDYVTPDQFLVLFLLVGLMCALLVMVMEGLEKILKDFLSSTINAQYSIYVYFILAASVCLFIFTIFSGYAESGFPFFYYRCVTNSCFYLVSGYTATFVISIYFAFRYIKTLSSKE